MNASMTEEILTALKKQCRHGQIEAILTHPASKEPPFLPEQYCHAIMPQGNSFETHTSSSQDGSYPEHHSTDVCLISLVKQGYTCAQSIQVQELLFLRLRGYV